MGSRFEARRGRGFAFSLVALCGAGVAAVAISVAAETQAPRALDRVPHAEPVNPDSFQKAEAAAPATGLSAPSVAPHRRETLGEAQQAMTAARARLDAANAAYSSMMKRNYPRGEAKAAIVAERDAARAASAQTAARLRDVGGEVPAAPAER